MPPFPLQPLSNVEWRDGRWVAGSAAPWLAAPGLERFGGRWLRLTYHAGLFDEHVRPLIRFRSSGGGATAVPMNGALTGVASWIGRMPEDTAEVAFSPVRQPGAFSFALVEARAVSRLALLARGLRRDPWLALTACAARLIGAREEARHCLSFAALATALDDYPGWKRTHSRPIDLAGFDRPHSDWTLGPVIGVTVEPGNPEARRRTIASIEAQSYPRWRMRLPDGMGAREDLVVRVRAGDLFSPHAFAAVVEHLAPDPTLEACYGDDEEGEGSALRARLLPDQDPLSAGSAAAAPGLFRRADIVSPRRLGHVRRLLLHRASPASPRVVPVPPPAAAPVTAIIPTRDRPRLLAACLAGLRGHDPGVPLEVVIVDNGSVDPDALRLLDEVAARPGTRVLRDARPFDYAALCNAGAALATTPLLLFLNNDVVPVASGWAARLAAWAARPDVGAAGARLLYPDGRLQHGGVVVGLGGTALHLHHRTRDPHGYLGQLDHARRIGAVTGAVLMVERAKFEAVGGFDAGTFPILLNDVDLCLRLAARGWHTVYEPAATLTHLESASRGRSARPLRLHGEERRRFATRWAEVIRDDPSFHPALSLTSVDPALG